jgi:hypothetical protein
MKKYLPVIIISILLIGLIWFVFKKVLPKLDDNKTYKPKNAADALAFVNSLPKI